MDAFKQLETFVAVVTLGSLSAAARAEGIGPAMVGRRLDALEDRLGTRLLLRTTRSVTPTQEGAAFFEEAQRILGELADAEAAVGAGNARARGVLRLSAPAGFGRRHVAPHLPAFQAQHPDVKVALDLSDRLVDLARERIDCAIRISDLADSSLIAHRLAGNRRVVVASPAYLAQHGIPRTLDDLASHNCLALGESQSRGWAFVVDGRPVNLRVSGSLECSDGAVLHDWARRGLGLTWRSLWEVKDELSDGRLVTVLDSFSSPDYPVCAVVAQRRFLPQRVRVFIEFLKACYDAPGYWD